MAVVTNKNFEDLFECLNRRGVRALVVGAHAVAFHAKPRYTKDVDILVEPSVENAERILQALVDFGFGGLDLSVDDFSRPGVIVQLGIAPNRVDLITSLGGVSFVEAWAGKVAGRYGRWPVFYIGLAELRRAKQAAGRPQDLADLEWLKPPE
ncbi:MAG: hypothetical protein HC897_09655 [Thermoanaerobaculia bacterium]|nr:hypothetical protein [Thermoanaerobaculia bacterium]